MSGGMCDSTSVTEQASAVSLDDLQMFEPYGVGVTAELQADGVLSPVGGLWRKLGAETIDLARRGLLRVVVVADTQNDVPSEYLQEEAEPLRVIKAKTVADAVRQLNAQTLPRRAIQQYERQACQYIDILGKAVPIERCYQAVPLLREVKRERLPRNSRPIEGDEDMHPELGTVDILRWEEEIQGQHVAYERLELGELFQNFQTVIETAKSNVPRFVVLGPPGSGKSTLVQYLTWQAVNGHLKVTGRQLIPTIVRLREWEAQAGKEGGSAPSLAEYLTKKYPMFSHAPSAKQWQTWLQRGEVLLLLDGLDEIEGRASLDAVKKNLISFAQCPTVLTCRTVSFEQHRALCPEFPVFTLAGLDYEQRDTYVRAFPTQYSTYYNPDQLIKQLTHLPQLSQLAANPLLLSVICYVKDSLESIPLPLTRAALYKKVIEKLLARRPKRIEVHYPGEEPDLGEKISILSQVALHLFVGGERRLTFSGQALGEALKQALSHAGYGNTSAPWANALRKDLEQNSGILRGSAEQGYFFLHLTIQEFLVAMVLAKHVNQGGWETSINMAGKLVRIDRLIDRKVWDPRWQEVITFLSGQLDAPLPLLTLLTNERKDDVFRHRLALTALCLPEAQMGLDSNGSAIIDRITAAVFSQWLQYERKGTDPAVPHLTRALPALGQVNGRLNGVPLVEWCCRQLRNPQAGARHGIIKALGQIRETVAQYPEAFSALITQLQDPDVLVRSSTVKALRRIGPAGEQQANIALALVHIALYEPNWFVRTEAVETVQQLGAAVTQNQAVIALLIHALQDSNSRVRLNAIGMIRKSRDAAFFSSDPVQSWRRRCTIVITT